MKAKHFVSIEVGDLIIIEDVLFRVKDIYLHTEYENSTVEMVKQGQEPYIVPLFMITRDMIYRKVDHETLALEGSR